MRWTSAELKASGRRGDSAPSDTHADSNSPLISRVGSQAGLGAHTSAALAGSSVGESSAVASSSAARSVVRSVSGSVFVPADPGVSTARADPGFRSLNSVDSTADPQAGKITSRWLGRFTLESGVVLPDLVCAYRHDGVPVGEGRQILVAHALTGSADAAGDWWAPLIGPGQILDTEKFGVICINLLGSRYGTSGPISRNTVTGKPYGRAFPRITVRDQARAQWRLLDALGIGKLAVAWDHIQLEVVEKLGLDGLDLARQLAITTYRSEIDFEQRFTGRIEADGTPSIVSYLRHQGRKLLERFDEDTYCTLVRAMDTHDIGRDRDGLVPALRRLAAYGTRLTGVGIEGDILYGTNQVSEMVDAASAAGMDAAYREIHSTKGHDAFLVEWDQLTAILAEALK